MSMSGDGYIAGQYDESGNLHVGVPVEDPVAT
jgi:hypothetical protein